MCPSGHSFDIARSGYVNLLQPQDRRSKHPGDSREAVAARRRLHERGFTLPLLESITQILGASSAEPTLDAGAGDGFYLGHIMQSTGVDAHGIDISIAAVKLAARRYANAQWIVANADRFIPYTAASFSIILSITGRMNPPEFQRVLKKEGRVLVALSAPDDLIQLRGPGRDRVTRTVQEFAPYFELVRQSRATATAELDAAAVQDIRLSTYRPVQSKPPEASAVTFSLDLLLFQLKSSSPVTSRSLENFESTRNASSLLIGGCRWQATRIRESDIRYAARECSVRS
jgi:23S rRNA (guanine745-N1)-methyltransferase